MDINVKDTVYIKDGMVKDKVLHIDRGGRTIDGIWEEINYYYLEIHDGMNVYYLRRDLLSVDEYREDRLKKILE